MPLRRGAKVATRHVRKVAKPKPLRVAVLNSSYEGSSSTTKDFDDKWCTPAHWVDAKKLNYQFIEVALKKKDTYRDLRKLFATNKVDCYYNLCDGAKDEDRAGEEVIRTLEAFNAPFTGAESRSFEPTKIDMKMLAGNGDVKTPNFAVVEENTDVERACRHLQFPVIVKHISGYASVGITKDSKCSNMKALITRAKKCAQDFGVALVEEFITGREGTVLVCRDENSKDKVRVFPPIMTEFKGGAEDFAHFDNKWANLYWEDDKTQPKPLPNNDPAFERIIEMARNSFALIMNKVGYGRVDFRICDRTGTPYFLEINPNCGMFYSQEEGGDYADLMVKYDKDWNHNDFVNCQVQNAIRQAKSRMTWWHHTHTSARSFLTKASQRVEEGTSLFPDMTRPIPVVARILCKLEDAGVQPDGSGPSPHVGCAIYRADDKQSLVVVKHSCSPNLAFRHGPTCEMVTCQPVRKGEALTLDFSTVRDMSMPSFRCACGSPDCRKVITAQTPKLRFATKPKKLKKLKSKLTGGNQPQDTTTTKPPAPPPPHKIKSDASKATVPSTKAATTSAAASSAKPKAGSSSSASSKKASNVH